MILNAIAEKLKRQSKGDFKGRHFKAWLIVQAVTWYLRYPLSYRDLEEMFRECGFEVDHSTINRWVLAYSPVIEKRLRRFRRPHCGLVRIDETYVKIVNRHGMLTPYRRPIFTPCRRSGLGLPGAGRGCRG
ncbi:transposase-like protein [Rhizobium skierniewicense]|uniref:Transposase-like protein n=1 Tax=Rhizobium skierniewicense TaxID=984260 RepID=A0A7W6CES2_9HYPH|nr:transposase-like protein [Rhizobium skierniewicense]